MHEALKTAGQSKDSLPCGVVIVKNSKIIAKACNNQDDVPDITAHAEMNALREACKKLKRKNLSDCTIYCTCEPCLMCLSAIIWAKIPRLCYSVPLKDAVKTSKNKISLTVKQVISKASFKMEIIAGILEKEVKQKLYLLK